MFNKDRLLAIIQREFSNGLTVADRAGVHARTFVEFIVTTISDEFAQAEHDVMLALEQVREGDCVYAVRSLVIHHNGKTHLVPLSCSSNVAMLNGTPIYLCHAHAAETLVDAITEEVARIMDAEAARAMALEFMREKHRAG